MGVFKDLAIQDGNIKTSNLPLCSVCGGINQTASNYCFACVSRYGGKTCGYCGIRVDATSAMKCHAECTTVYCAEHIVKYGGGVK